MESDIRNWVAGFDREGLLAYVSLLYYSEGLRQTEIATRMGVSRATIVNYLREARESGVVDVRIRGSSLTSSGLSRKLCEAFDLKDAYVAYVSPQDRKGDGADARSLVATGRVGAIALLDVLKPGDNVGVSWGVTVKAVADQLPRISMTDVTVWQMVGSMDTHRLPAAETCAIQIAGRLGAACHTLHAPAILSSVELAEALRAEPAIRRQLARLNDLDATVFSIGDVSDQTHLVAAGIADLPELRRAIGNGAQGIVCGRYYDADGDPVDDPLNQRLIAIQITDLKSIRHRLLVAAGLPKLAATRAALRGSFATHLCVDEALASGLLESAD